MKTRHGLIMAALGLMGMTAGCTKDLANLVDVRPTENVNLPSLPPPLPVPTPTESSGGVKFSPGSSLSSSAGGLAMKVNVTPTSEKLSGGTLSMEVGISRDSAIK